MSNRSKAKPTRKNTRVFIPPTSNRGMQGGLNQPRRNYNIKGGRRP